MRRFVTASLLSPSGPLFTRAATITSDGHRVSPVQTNVVGKFLEESEQAGVEDVVGVNPGRQYGDRDAVLKGQVAREEEEEEEEEEDDDGGKEEAEVHTPLT